jgi:hypothetical protein
LEKYGDLFVEGAKIFGGAFAFGRIQGIIGKIGWGEYIAWIILVAIIAAILSAIFSIQAVGWVISAMLAPALAVFFRSLGILYNEGK